MSDKPENQESKSPRSDDVGGPPAPEPIWPPPEGEPEPTLDAPAPEAGGGAPSSPDEDLSWASEPSAPELPPSEPSPAPAEAAPPVAAGAEPTVPPGDDYEPEPEEEYELPPGPPGAPETMVAGTAMAPVAVTRVELSCRVRPDSEAEIGRLWGQVFFAVDHPSPKTVIVTAARRRDGSTQIATSLALVGAAADRELRIALIDFNLRNPRIAEMLGLRAEPGLSEVINGRSTLESAMQAIVLPNGNELHVLPAGAPVAQPLGLLKSRQVQATIHRIAERYDHAILDVTAANAHPDPQVVGALVDGAVLVARASETPRETVAAAKKRLDFAGVQCLGLVLNQRSDPVPGFIYRNF